MQSKKVTEIYKALQHVASNERAIGSSRFFKTGVGQYGEGDLFLGVTVPEQRKIAKKYADIESTDIKALLASPYHEMRFVNVLCLVSQYKENPDKIFKLYVQYVGANKGINNWDLIDVSSEHVVGPYISEHMTHEERLAFINKSIASKDLWINRMIVLASFYQIKKGNEKMTFYIAERLLGHKHDLMHKAVGWMLREVGKRVNKKTLIDFLDTRTKNMQRTALRYAIEHLPETQRKQYLGK
jgi:3-methyladenine DNA glycosylase AlkD